MKTLAFFFLSQLCINFTAHGQISVSKVIHQRTNDEGVWENKNLREYTYDENGHLKKLEYLNYSMPKQSWTTIQRLISTHNANGQPLSHEIQLPESNHWRTTRSSYFTYDINGCNTELSNWQLTNSTHGENNQIRHAKTVNTFIAPCIVDSSFSTVTYYSLDSVVLSEFESYIKYYYENDYKKISESRGKKLENGLWELRENIRITEYNDNDDRILYIDSLISNGPKKSIYTYYPNEELQAIERFSWSNMDWSLSDITEYYYEYDKNGLITQKDVFVNVPSTSSYFNTSSENFDYYCDSLLRTEFTNSDRSIYEYINPAECFEFDKKDIEALVFPNPAIDIVRIYSAAFQSGEISVSIFNSSGKLFYQKEMYTRSEGLEIDIRQLPAGMYFLNLTGLGKSKTVKLIKSL